LLGARSSDNLSTANPRKAKGGPGKMGKKLPSKPVTANKMAMKRRNVSIPKAIA
jgi:hypothetical protein